LCADAIGSHHGIKQTKALKLDDLQWFVCSATNVVQQRKAFVALKQRERHVS